MSCTFWNMRRRLAQKKKEQAEIATSQENKTPETNEAKKPVKKTAVKKAPVETAVNRNDK